jgi:hypothetical protein
MTVRIYGREVHERSDVLAAAGIKDVELPVGWVLEPGKTAKEGPYVRPPSRKLRREFKRHTNREIGE